LLGGAVLIVVAVVGAVVWTAALSPVGYNRFSVTSLDRTLDIDRAGTYLVFEEFAGASQPDLPSTLEVSVFATDGRAVPSRRLIDPGERAAPHAYNLFGYEGRAIAEFSIPRPGRYLVQVRPVGAGSADPGEYRDVVPETIAVGRDLAAGWLGGWLGPLLMAVVPFVLGVALIVVWRRKSRASRTAHGRD
jgi:hypothetical protein